MILVQATGPLATLQDLGRPNCGYLGVSPSGAADRGALRLANRLVGNPEGCAAVETTFGGFAIIAQNQSWVAVTGAPTQLLVNATATSSSTTIALRPGDRLVIEPPRQGVRNYLAVRGGIEGPVVLGSRSRDVLSGLGPAPLQPGQVLQIGRPVQELPAADQAPPQVPGNTLTILPGPRTDWFSPAAWRSLVDDSWTVTPDCDRVAVRLAGAPLSRSRTDELPSEGLMRGAVQVPSSGQPLIFLSDHPVTGGYPVIAILTDQACDTAAQLRPGDVVVFKRRPYRRAADSSPRWMPGQPGRDR